LAEWLLLVGGFTGELWVFSLGHRGDENPKNVGSEAGLGDFLSFIRLALLLRIRTNLKKQKNKNININNRENIILRKREEGEKKSEI
jgi:hypothetical protein